MLPAASLRCASISRTCSAACASAAKPPETPRAPWKASQALRASASCREIDSMPARALPMAGFALSLALMMMSMELPTMTLWLLLLYYMLAAVGLIMMLFLLLIGHWLGVFFLTMAAVVFIVAAVVGIGQGLDRPWAHRLARILFMR